MWNRDVAHDAFDYRLQTDLYSLCVQKWNLSPAVSPPSSAALFSFPPVCGASNCSQTANVQHITHIHIHGLGYVSHLLAIDQHLWRRGSQMYRDLCSPAPPQRGRVSRLQVIFQELLKFETRRWASVCWNPLDISLWFPRGLCSTLQTGCELVALSFTNTESSGVRLIPKMEWQLIWRLKLLMQTFPVMWSHDTASWGSCRCFIVKWFIFLCDWWTTLLSRSLAAYV